MLVYDEMVLRNFWRIAIVTEVLPHRDSEISVKLLTVTHDQKFQV